jgi:hypothetical protein
VVGRVRGLVRAIREGDEAAVEDAVLRLSRSRGWLAPLALAVGAFVMLFDGLKLVFSNWRLTLIQILPAMWIWLAMLDLKVHVLHGKAFIVRHGPLAVVLVAAITAISAAAFFLNAVFAFAIAEPGPPQIRPAFARAWAHRRVVLGFGAIVGVCLGFSTIVVTRWGPPWFALSLSVVIGVMMICYVGVPSRLIGVTPTYSRRDKLAASAVSGTLGAAVCTPPYVLGRLGILMLGSPSLVIPGIVVLTFGFALEAGATGAVKAVKMSAKLVAGHHPTAAGASPADDPLKRPATTPPARRAPDSPQ